MTTPDLIADGLRLAEMLAATNPPMGELVRRLCEDAGRLEVLLRVAEPESRLTPDLEPEWRLTWVSTYGKNEDDHDIRLAIDGATP